MYAAQGRDQVLPEVGDLVSLESSDPGPRIARDRQDLNLISLLVLVSGDKQATEHGRTAQDGCDPSGRAGESQKSETVCSQQSVGVVDGLGHDHAEHAGYTGRG